MTWQSKLGYVALITLVWLSVANAIDIIPEDGDAGGLPNTAQIVEQRVNLDDGDDILEIRGSINPADDEDMYRFEISLPSLFSATTNLSGDNIRIEDTKLFLFDVNGNGICANEDDPNAGPFDLNRRRAVFPRGGLATCMLVPGTYFLAISTFERVPVDAQGNNLFLLEPPNAIVPPIAPNVVIRDWAGSGRDGEYAIQITGVNYPPPKCLEPTVTDGPGDTRILSITVQDSVLGIENIEVVNTTINIDQVDINFVPGASEGTVSAVDTNPFMSDQLDVRVTNTRGLSTICTLNSPQQPEQPAIAPTCQDRFILEGAPVVETTAQDEQSGLSKIQLVFVKNATVTVDGQPLPTPPPESRDFILFNPPTTDPVTIRAEKIDLDERATVVIDVFDNDVQINPETGLPEPKPNIRPSCDPILTRLLVPDGELVLQKTFTDIPEDDSYIALQNGRPGLTLLTIKVNDGRTKILRLKDGETQQLDVASEMVRGLNTMSFKAIGRPGTEANVVISNQPGEIVSSQSPAAAGISVRRSTLKLRSYNPEWGQR